MKESVQEQKVVIISAPSGAGKSSIIRYLMEHIPALSFSVSACSRSPRAGETEGRHYYFFSVDEFKRRVAAGDFIEWEEVYPGSFYGTLKSELHKIWDAGKIPLFEVDVAGGLNLKKQFGTRALSVFIRPPSLAVLEERLRGRGTDSEESLMRRIGKAEYEMSFAVRYDRIVLNQDIDTACRETAAIITDFMA